MNHHKDPLEHAFESLKTGQSISSVNPELEDALMKEFSSATASRERFRTWVAIALAAVTVLVAGGAGLAATGVLERLTRFVIIVPVEEDEVQGEVLSFDKDGVLHRTPTGVSKRVIRYVGPVDEDQIRGEVLGYDKDGILHRTPAPANSEE